jgi:hypothetical protein
MCAAAMLLPAAIAVHELWPEISSVFSSDPTLDSPDRIDSAERSEEGICDTYADIKARLEETDCNILPPILENSQFDAEDPEYATDDTDPYGKTVASILVDSDGKTTTKGNYEALSDEYKAAFAAAFEDPAVVNLVRATNGVSINISDGYENGYYRHESNDIVLKFSTTVEQADRLHTTFGSIRSVLIHEGTHSLVQRWNDRARKIEEEFLSIEDDANQLEYYEKNMDDNSWYYAAINLFSSHTDILNSELNAIRLSDKLYFTGNLVTMRMGLKELRDESTSPQDDEKIELVIDAISELIEQAESGGWDTASLGLYALILSVDDTDFSAGQAFLDLMKDDKVQEKIGEAAANIEIKLAEEINTVNTTNEDDVLFGLDADGAGHGHDSESERVASFMASAHINPDGLIETINKLTDDHRAAYKEFAKTLIRLTKDDPSAEHLYLDLVYVHAGIKD